MTRGPGQSAEGGGAGVSIGRFGPSDRGGSATLGRATRSGPGGKETEGAGRPGGKRRRRGGKEGFGPGAEMIQKMFKHLFKH